MADLPSPHQSAPRLDEMCADAIRRRHRELRRDVRRVREQLRGLATPGSPLPDIVQQFEGLAAYLELHLVKEENILFPALEALAEAARAGGSRPPLPFPSVLNPVRLLEGEHVRVHDLLARVTEAARLAQPEAPDQRWPAVHGALTALGATLAEHVRFEDEVLFPTALEVERRLV
jgi:regulator of cell morphogenesis and NO signaling